MRTNRTNFSMAVCALLLVTGCKKDEPSTTTSTTSAAPTAAAAPKPKDDCPSGLTKVADPGFCIKLPSGYTLGETKQQKDNAEEPILVEFLKDGKSHDGFSVRGCTETLDRAKTGYASFLDTKSNTIKGQGDLLGGKGFWFRSASNKYKGETIGVVVQLAKYVVKCEMAGSGDDASFQTVLDTCKTITPIG